MSDPVLVTKVGDVAVVFLQHERLLDETNIRIIGERLIELANSAERPRILVNFEKVDYLSSAVLGKLIAVHKLVGLSKGSLKLCNLKPEIMEIFKVTKLHKVLDIQKDVKSAMNAFKKGR